MNCLYNEEWQKWLPQKASEFVSRLPLRVTPVGAIGKALCNCFSHHAMRAALSFFIERSDVETEIAGVGRRNSGKPQMAALNGDEGPVFQSQRLDLYRTGLNDCSQLETV